MILTAAQREELQLELITNDSSLREALYTKFACQTILDQLERTFADVREDPEAQM